MCSLRVWSYFYIPVEVYTGATSTNDQDLFVVELSNCGPVPGTGSSMQLLAFYTMGACVNSAGTLQCSS